MALIRRARYETCYSPVCSAPSTPAYWSPTATRHYNNSNSKHWNSRSFSTSSNNNGSSPAIVAIDSKIEQAMDLVKTHLMFAVREEVEVLRSKIVDLETHIHHLETENSILKDNIPEDLLKNLNLGKK